MCSDEGLQRVSLYRHTSLTIASAACVGECSAAHRERLSAGQGLELVCSFHRDMDGLCVGVFLRQITSFSSTPGLVDKAAARARLCFCKCTASWRLHHAHLCVRRQGTCFSSAPGTPLGGSVGSSYARISAPVSPTAGLTPGGGSWASDVEVRLRRQQRTARFIRSLVAPRISKV